MRSSDGSYLGRLHTFSYNSALAGLDVSFDKQTSVNAVTAIEKCLCHDPYAFSSSNNIFEQLKFELELY